MAAVSRSAQSSCALFRRFHLAQRSHRSRDMAKLKDTRPVTRCRNEWRRVRGRKGVSSATVLQFPVSILIRRQDNDWQIVVGNEIRGLTPTRMSALQAALRLAQAIVMSGGRVQVREQIKPLRSKIILSWRDRPHGSNHAKAGGVDSL
jgi:hypothetical protein